MKPDLGDQFVSNEIINIEDDSGAAIVHFRLRLDRISNTKLETDNAISFFLKIM